MTEEKDMEDLAFGSRDPERHPGSVGRATYGWSAEEAKRFDGQSSEVRLYHVTSDGERRDLASGRDGGFEFGYGGTGPHESAAAIVHDITGEAGRWREHRSPADLRKLVPEVFTRGHDEQRLVILAAAVKERLNG